MTLKLDSLPARLRDMNLKERLKDIGATLFIVGALLLSGALDKKQSPQIIYAEDKKAIDCVPLDEQTKSIMTRHNGKLQCEKHVRLTEHQQLVLMNLQYPINRE